MRNPNLVYLIALAASGLGLSGCYTQLYTQGYVERSREYQRPVAGDTLREGSGAADSAGLAAADSADSAVIGAEAGRTVIVNNYYDDQPYYRGYAYSDWEYPLFSFGFYSSRYRSYSDPYWWNDSRYHGRYWNRGGHRGHYPDGAYSGGGSQGSAGGGGGGKRLYSPASKYPSLNKGRRGDAPARNDIAASSGSEPSESAPPVSAAPKASSNGSSSDASNSSANSGSRGQRSQSGAPAKEKSNDYPTQKKGRR